MLILANWTALFVSLSVFIPAMVGAVISVLNYSRNQKQDVKLALVQNKVIEVHEIVNSQRTEMVGQIAELNRQVKELHERLEIAATDMKGVKESWLAEHARVVESPFPTTEMREASTVRVADGPKKE